IRRAASHLRLPIGHPTPCRPTGPDSALELPCFPCNDLLSMKPRNIPSLDGLRAVSVSLVVASHMSDVLAQKITFLPCWFYLMRGALGVQIFFVISGFLITLLLLKELNATGSISLGRFYFRRAIRIFPPFYAYLAVALALTLAGCF